MKMKRLRDATRPARRAVAKRIFDFPEPEGWDHAAAQRYEVAAARRTIMEFFPPLSGICRVDQLPLVRVQSYSLNSNY